LLREIAASPRRLPRQRWDSPAETFSSDRELYIGSSDPSMRLRGPPLAVVVRACSAARPQARALLVGEPHQVGFEREPLRDRLFPGGSRKSITEAAAGRRVELAPGAVEATAIEASAARAGGPCSAAHAAKAGG